MNNPITEDEKNSFKEMIFCFPFAVDIENVEYKSDVENNVEIYEIYFPSFNWNNMLYVSSIARLAKFFGKSWKFSSSIEFNIEPLDDSIKLVSSLLPYDGFIISDTSPREGATEGYELLSDSLKTLLINSIAIWETGFRIEAQKYAEFCHQLDEFCLQMIGR